MKFLNKKEQILQIKLTQYGKHILSKGRFEPTHYSFFDDNILYDSEFAGISEHQNMASNRIVKDTPQLEAQYVFDSIENQISKVNKYIRSQDEIQHTYGQLAELGSEATQPQAAQFHALAAPMGTSKLDKKFAPAWSIRFLKGTISGSVDLLTGSYQNSFIPQINPIPITYKYRIVPGNRIPAGERSDLEDGDNFFDNPDAHPNQTAIDEMTTQAGLGYGEFVDQFDDGNYLAVYDDSVILEVVENNTDNDKENFDIEVYRVEDQVETLTGEVKEVYVPLYFSKTPEMIKNGILLGMDEISQEEQVSEDDPSYVDYFFNVRVDKEIDQQMLVEVRDKIDLAQQQLEDPSRSGPSDQVKISDLYKPINEETKTEDECD